MKSLFDYTYKVARRISIFVVGTTVLIVGLVMLVTPGPAIVVIPLGLAILGAEFAWARYWLKRLRRSVSFRNADGRAKRAAAYRANASRDLPD